MSATMLRASTGRAFVSRTFVRPTVHSHSSIMLRAVDKATEDAAAPTSGSTVFWQGKSYTPSEWEAFSTGVDASTSSPPVAPLGNSSPAPVPFQAQSPAVTPTFTEVMAFNGAAPEIVNGRLAMLGFVAAVFAEIASGKGVLGQWSQEPTLVGIAFTIFIVASLIPMFNRTPREAFGPFTPPAELINGRAAMIGFASLIAIEAVKGSALF